MDRVRTAVIGSGGIFRGAHLPAFPEIDDARLVALCDVSQENLDKSLFQLKKLYEERALKEEGIGNIEKAKRLRADAASVKVYTDREEMLKKEGIDLVNLCTPPGFHANIAVELLNKGIHVMCEKPMAKTWLDCVDVIEAVEKTGKFYQHNENWIFDGGWYNAKKFIDSGAIGELQLTFIAAAHGGPEGVGWFWNPDIAGGGALLDNGIHALTVSWFLAGFEKEPTKVKVVEPYGLSTRMKTRILAGKFEEVEVEDDAHIVVRFENTYTGSWATSHVEGSWAHRDSMDTVIIGSSGTMRFTVADGKKYILISDPFDHERRITVDGPSSFYGEVKNMVECVVNNTRPLCDEKIGADSTAIVGAAYLSEMNGRKAVSLQEFKDFALDIKKKHGPKAAEALINTLLAGIKKK